MRNAGPLILIGLIILAGAAAYLLWSPQGSQLGDIIMARATNKAPTSAKKPEPAPEPHKEAAKSKPAGRNSGDKGPKPGEAAEAEEKKILTAQVLPPVPPPPAMPFPNAPDIPIGMERSKLLADFGKPIMRTTAVDRDRLLETYVYLHSDPNTATFVLLQNARVVSAHTTIY